MFDMNDFPIDDLPEPQEEDFKPWEQRIAPGMSSGGGGDFDSGSESGPPDRLVQVVDNEDLMDTIDEQTRLVSYPMVDRFKVPQSDNSIEAETNEQAWHLFVSEQLYDTRRVTLKHFHLFEWFPICPGEFHTPQAQTNRNRAYQNLVETADGSQFFDPGGKARMLRGGVGAVRLRPRMVSNEAHYFMSVSSNGVCHEGFPILIPRRFYGQVKPRLLQEGAVPVHIKGEMRYLLDEIPTFFGSQRRIPALYLHVDELEVLPEPRREVNRYAISAAISFVGEFENHEGVYSTFATFDPAKTGDLERTVTWLEQFYVTETYKGIVITDFDEVKPRFPGAVFGLPELMAGNLDQERVKQFLKIRGISDDAGRPFYLILKTINTQGGAYIAGDVDTGGGDFIGRDQITRTD
jgi:hypothetical protein